MNNKNTFLLFKDLLEPVDGLSNEDAGMFIKAILHYQNGGDIPELSPAANVTFVFTKQQLDRSDEYYEMICERNRINGAKGGRPTKPKEPTGLSGLLEKPNITQTNPDEPRITLPHPSPSPHPHPKPKKKKEEKELSPDGEPLWQKMENAFLSRMNEADYSWGIERKALNALVKKAEARENPEEFAHALLNTFWKMTKRKEKFWADQAFLPHTLNGVSIYPQVIKEMEKREAGKLSAEDKEFIKGMKF